MNFSGPKILMEIAELKDMNGKKNQVVYRTRTAHDIEVAFELLLNRYGEETDYPHSTLIVTMDDMHGAAPIVVIPYRALVRFYWDTPASRQIARNTRVPN